MQLVIRKVIDKVCCEKMGKMLDKKAITHSEWNFYWNDCVIFYCPFCGESCF